IVMGVVARRIVGQGIKIADLAVGDAGDLQGAERALNNLPDLRDRDAVDGDDIGIVRRIIDDQTAGGLVGIAVVGRVAVGAFAAAFRFVEKIAVTRRQAGLVNLIDRV